MIEVSQYLAEPWLKERLNNKTLRRNIRQDIGNILNISVENVKPACQNKKRKICFYCPSNKRRMTTTYCNQCEQAICGEHRGNICTSCATV